MAKSAAIWQDQEGTPVEDRMMDKATKFHEIAEAVQDEMRVGGLADAFPRKDPEDGFYERFAWRCAQRYCAALEAELERYEKRATGFEWCEACETWFSIEDMHIDNDGVWLCGPDWEELLAAS